MSDWHILLDPCNLYTLGVRLRMPAKWSQVIHNYHSSEIRISIEILYECQAADRHFYMMHWYVNNIRWLDLLIMVPKSLYCMGNLPWPDFGTHWSGSLGKKCKQIYLPYKIEREITTVKIWKIRMKLTIQFVQIFGFREIFTKLKFICNFITAIRCRHKFPIGIHEHFIQIII